jgi:DNA-binding NarL/FixJ family response regulator
VSPGAVRPDATDLYASAVPVRVVLVDDVPEVRRLVRTALRLRGGFDVVGEAGDGAGAVRLAEQLQPDIVVLDLGLPDITGRDVLARVRAQSAKSRIVVFSGGESPDRAWIAERVEGYVLKDAEVDYLVDLLETVGRRHGDVAALALPADPLSVRHARWFLRSTLREWDLGEMVADAELVVSELVTNAITHANSAPELRLLAMGSTVRVEVLDDGAGTPDPKPPSASGEHGRGMHLISAVATAWGVELVPGDGKIVWAELPHRALDRTRRL